MKLELEPTGERMIEDAYRSSVGAYVIYLMHSASYAFADPYCRGRRVLDLGCGSGYGSHRISASAASVVGVDVAEEAIGFARARYAAPNLEFKQIGQGGRLLLTMRPSMSCCLSRSSNMLRMTWATCRRPAASSGQAAC
ncbi:class I SAM-dependent methyltransferase [Arenimonas daejeonensis]|uniref:class I SAM-dependent methyltransferase n=1 Tax=Arenimonas daejeonensis TaxID=370777 RepID=UPI0011BE7454|nr:class I SAM-dependent methyltransferase [Arenimonas daejeonensis]